MPVCVFDVFEYLSSQGSFAYGLKALLQLCKICVAGEARILGAEALEVSECVFVNDADKTVKLQKRILKRRGRERGLLVRRYCLFYRLADFVCRLVYVAKPVSLIDDNEIPVRLPDIRLFRPGELIGADDGRICLKRIEVPGTDGLIEGARLQNDGGKKEFVGEFLASLLAKICRANNEEATLALRPFLRQENASFDGFSQTDFVGKDHAFRERRAKSE